MTDNQRNEIQQLRLDGNGYVRIAQALGLSESCIKSFCRRNPLQTTSRQTRTRLTCPQCGAPISENRRFCSDACRTAWWNAHREHRTAQVQSSFTCQHCGKTFSGYPKQQPKYCCHGQVVERTWTDRSRSESWTPTMKDKARQNAQKRKESKPCQQM